MSEFIFDRTAQIEANRHNMVNRDPAWVQYTAQINFLEIFSRIMDDIEDDGEFVYNGKRIRVDSVGGAIATTHVMETEDARLNAVTGITNLQINTQKQLWKMSS